MYVMFDVLRPPSVETGRVVNKLLSQRAAIVYFLSRSDFLTALAKLSVTASSDSFIQRFDTIRHATEIVNYKQQDLLIFA